MECHGMRPPFPTLTARVPPMKSGWSVLMYSCSQATSSRSIFSAGSAPDWGVQGAGCRAAAAAAAGRSSVKVLATCMRIGTGLAKGGRKLWDKEAGSGCVQVAAVNCLPAGRCCFILQWRKVAHVILCTACPAAIAVCSSAPPPPPGCNPTVLRQTTCTIIQNPAVAFCSLLLS